MAFSISLSLSLFLSPSKGDAMGKIYIDDGHSFDYKEGKFLLRHFTFTTNTLIVEYVCVHLCMRVCVCVCVAVYSTEWEIFDGSKLWLSWLCLHQTL